MTSNALQKIWSGTVALVALLLLAACTSEKSTVGTDSEQMPSSSATTPEVQPELVVVESGFSEVYTGDRSYTSWAVLIDNPHEDLVATAVTVDVSFLDDEGTGLGSESETLEVVLPGRMAVARTHPPTALSTGAGVFDVAELAVSVEVGGWRATGESDGTFEVVPQEMVADTEPSILTVTAEVTSTFSVDEHDAAAVAVFRDEQGRIIGGIRRTISSVPPGVSQITIEEWEELVGVTDFEVFLSPSPAPTTDPPTSDDPGSTSTTAP